MKNTMSNNPAPGYAKKPDHSVIASAYGGCVIIRLGGQVIADSQHALAVVESGYGVAYYLPVGDVLMEASTLSNYSTYCPFKGHASYLSFNAGGTASANVAWRYETPYDEALMLRGHISFYGKSVDSILIE